MGCALLRDCRSVCQPLGHDERNSERCRFGLQVLQRFSHSSHTPVSATRTDDVLRGSGRAFGMCTSPPGATDATNTRDRRKAMPGRIVTGQQLEPLPEAEPAGNPSSPSEGPSFPMASPFLSADQAGTPLRFRVGTGTRAGAPTGSQESLRSQYSVELELRPVGDALLREKCHPLAGIISGPGEMQFGLQCPGASGPRQSCYRECWGCWGACWKTT